jgi:hypothetical protein
MKLKTTEAECRRWQHEVNTQEEWPYDDAMRALSDALAAHAAAEREARIRNVCLDHDGLLSSMVLAILEDGAGEGEG